MDINEIHKRVTAEIDLIKEAMEKRSNEIASLVELNNEADERILILQKVEEKISSALAELHELGPLIINKAASKPKKKFKLTNLIPEMLANAGGSGMTLEEIIDFHYKNTGQEIKLTSLRSLLYRLATESKVERRENGAWRIKQQQAVA